MYTVRYNTVLHMYYTANYSSHDSCLEGKTIPLDSDHWQETGSTRQAGRRMRTDACVAAITNYWAGMVDF